MDLNFELQGGYFIAEFEVTSDFNLHIEKDPIGEFLVYQRTAGGQYDLVQNFKKDKGDDSIIDYDFQALVYPKWIKIKSSVKPLVATITTDGEIKDSNDRIYFDGAKLRQSNCQEILYHISSNVYRLDAPLGHNKYEGFCITFRFSYNDEYAYVSFPNKIIMPNAILVGSYALTPNPDKVGQSISFYEYLEEMNTILGNIPINEIKNAEVTKKEVEDWCDTP